MLFNLLCSIAIPFALGVATANFEDENNYVNYEINNKIDTSESSSEVSYPIYDDLNNSITLSAYQLNNYIFENLYNVQINGNDFDFSEVTLSYLSSNYIYDEQNEGVEWFSNSENYIVFVMDYNIFESYNQEILTNYKFYNRESGENLTFINDLIIINNQSGSAYQELKTAIQADIQANEQSGNGYVSVLTDMISLLVGGITGIATGVGNGVQDLVSQLFLNNGALSTFGAIVCIFGGIALAVGLSRLIFNWIQSLGNR